MQIFYFALIIERNNKGKVVSKIPFQLKSKNFKKQTGTNHEKNQFTVQINNTSCSCCKFIF